MVAAAKLRRAQPAAEAARPYAERMAAVMASLASQGHDRPGEPEAARRHRQQDQTHLLVVCTSDRGLAGAFNSNIVRAARRKAEALIAEGKTVYFYLVGRKGRAVIGRALPEADHPPVRHQRDQAGRLRRRPGDRRRRRSTATSPTASTSSTSSTPASSRRWSRSRSASRSSRCRRSRPTRPPPASRAAVEYEPDEDEILAELLPRNVAVQIFRALLENAASEQGSRMTAMDNATRNAGDMINRLTIQYNRTRQAAITTELIEIISGAEAL